MLKCIFLVLIFSQNLIAFNLNNLRYFNLEDKSNLIKDTKFYHNLKPDTKIINKNNLLIQNKNYNSFNLDLRNDELNYNSLKEPLYNNNIITCEPAGTNGFYSLGVSYYLKQNYDLTDFQFAGASAGAWNCLLLSLNDDNNFRNAINKIINIKKDDSRKPNFKKLITIQNEIQNIINNDLDQKNLNYNNLYIGICFLKGFRISSELVYNFSSISEITDCCRASSHIPFVTGNLLRKYKNIIAIDGGLTNLPLSLIKNPYFNIHTGMWGREFGDNFKADKDLKNLFKMGYLDSYLNRDILNRKFKKKKKFLLF